MYLTKNKLHTSFLSYAFISVMVLTGSFMSIAVVKPPDRATKWSKTILAYNSRLQSVPAEASLQQEVRTGGCPMSIVTQGANGRLMLVALYRLPALNSAEPNP